MDLPQVPLLVTYKSQRTSGGGRSHEEIGDVASWVVPHVERPQFHGPLLKRTRCQHTSLKENLCVCILYEALSLLLMEPNKFSKVEKTSQDIFSS